MACQSGQRLLMVLLLTILTSLVTAAPVTEDTYSTAATEVKFSDIENTLDSPLTQFRDLLKDLDDKSFHSNNSHHHLLQVSADILEEIRTSILDFLNEHFQELAHNHTLKDRVSCNLKTKEYEHALLAEICQKFSSGSIGYTVKADVDCILSSLFLINSYLQDLISFHGSLHLKKIAKLSKMLNTLATHFQIYKEDVSTKIEASCKNYTATMNVYKTEAANGNGVDETSNKTEVAMSSVNQNESTIASEILSEEDKKQKEKEIFEEEEKTLGEIKHDVLLLNGLVKKIESEQKEAEVVVGLVQSNATSPVQSNTSDTGILNVNAESNAGVVVESNDTFPAGSSFANLTESNVVNTEKANAGVVVESTGTMPAGSNVVNTEKPNTGVAVESNGILLAGSNVVNTEKPNAGVAVESKSTLPAGSNVVNTEKPNAGVAVGSNDTLLAGSNVVNTEKPNAGVAVESTGILPAGSNVVNTEKPNAGVAVDSNDTLPAGSNVVNTEKANAGVAVESTGTLPAGSNVVNTEKPNAGVVVDSNDTLLAGSNVVNTEKPSVVATSNDVEKNDSDESMLKTLKSSITLLSNATNENEDAFIDKVKGSLGNEGELLTTKETPKEDELEDIFEKLF